jgi:hypothetical protein
MGRLLKALSKIGNTRQKCRLIGEAIAKLVEEVRGAPEDFSPSHLLVSSTILVPKSSG